jgi:hypothetical protein
MSISRHSNISPPERAGVGAAGEGSILDGPISSGRAREQNQSKLQGLPASGGGESLNGQGVNPRKRPPSPINVSRQEAQRPFAFGSSRRNSVMIPCEAVEGERTTRIGGRAVSNVERVADSAGAGGGPVPAPDCKAYLPAVAANR